IYRTIDKRVVIYLIADGRRDMQSLLARRLLGA
ncbi:MAG: plasmid stabilization protein, partial [Alphaproteobacteria bacterium HGW-Alphaproteobacteria-11]